ncbi:MAG TPA: DJ-1/PfpI family protein [Ignavibacteriaceae bacterium]|nr:DJ-1/PfpI family protein [Ignavibacteriaceae bacterium]
MITPNQNSFLIFLPAKDFNEEEYLTVRKLILKAGKNVFITSDDHTSCSGSKGMKVKSDTSFSNINTQNFAGIILIGGKGTRPYWTNFQLHNILNNFHNSGRIISAICSAPVILSKAGILKNKSATCNPDDKMELINSGIDYNDRNVVIDGNVVTADGPKSAVQFTEAVLHLLKQKMKSTL